MTYAFTARGRTFVFDNRDDYLRAFSNYLIVDSRREHGREVTEEMLLSPEVQFELNLTNSTKEDK